MVLLQNVYCSLLLLCYCQQYWECCVTPAENGWISVFPRDKWSNNVLKSSWFQEVNSWIFNYKGLKSITTRRGGCLICRKREISEFCDLNDLNTKSQQAPLLKGNVQPLLWTQTGYRIRNFFLLKNWMRKGWHIISLLSARFTLTSSAL